MSPAMFIDPVEDLVAPDDLDEDELQDLIPLRAVGIDLGTSKCCMAGWRGSSAQVIPSPEGGQTQPSCIAFTPFQRLFGNAALKQAYDNTQGTVFESKMLLGKDFAAVKGETERWPFKVVLSDDGVKPAVEVPLYGKTQTFSPEELYSMTLSHIKLTAQEHLELEDGEGLKAVLTVPSSFSHFQRKAVSDAAAIAGVEVLQLVNDTTAAAIQYAMDSFDAGGAAESLVVCDVGAAFCDVSVVVRTGKIVEMKRSSGLKVGGRDVDWGLTEHLADDFKARYGSDPRDSARAMQRLETEARRAKHTLTVTDTTTIELPSLHDGVDFFFGATRELLNEIVEQQLRPCVDLVQKMSEASKAIHGSPKLVVAGGCCRIPRFQDMLQQAIGDQYLSLDLNLEEAAARGAAALAASLLGYEDSNAEDLMTFDVVNAAFGLETVGGELTPIIPSSAAIPIKKKIDFSTYFDKQPSSLVQVYEGDSPVAQDNSLLTKFELAGIPPLVAGAPRIVATFGIDVSGVLTMDIGDTSSGGENLVEMLVPLRFLTEEQMQQSKVAEAEMKATDDSHSMKKAAWAALDECLAEVRSVVRDPCMFAYPKDPETREALEVEMEKVVACLETFPLSDVAVYEAALADFDSAAEAVLRPQYETEDKDRQDGHNVEIVEEGEVEEEAAADAALEEGQLEEAEKSSLQGENAPPDSAE